MSNTKRNKALAVQLGWKRKTDFATGMPYWNAPDKKGTFWGDSPPDFCGDSCAAMKYLLPFLWKVVLRVDLFTTKDGCRLGIPKLFREKKQSGFHGTSIPLALAAAVEALKRGEK